MSCAPLAVTGEPVLAMIGLGVAALVVGVVLLVVTRRKRARFTGTAVLLLVAAGAVLALGGQSTVARADTADCSSTSTPPAGTPYLVVVQTSTMTGLAPGIAPVDITGTVTNTGTASKFVAAVTVDITGVVPVRAGECTATDYVLLDVVMPVGVTLQPGGSADFTGARIGFNNKTINQDACQGALVNLRYIAS